MDDAATRRTLLKAGLAAGLLGLAGRPRAAWLEQGFDNGWRELVPYPQKMPLLRITTRPVHLETPFSQFDRGLITPNEAVFVRYHLAGHPLDIDPAAHTLTIDGKVRRPLTLTLSELQRFPRFKQTVVMQCAGNGRGLFQPRVQGAQLGNGSMACVEMAGARLADVLAAAGVMDGARQIACRGTDQPALEATPAFVRSLDLADALRPEAMIAWEMNGQPLPVLNGYPIRLVIPGFYAACWIKHLSHIEVLDHMFDGWFASQAYTVPDTPDNGVPPGTKPDRTARLTRMKVRSFITHPAHGDAIAAPDGRLALRGIAFDGGSGIRRVEVSADGGDSWRQAELGPDIGRFAFRPWTLTLDGVKPGPLALMARAAANDGQRQPLRQPWNPGGYARNVAERVEIVVAEAER
ncbi:molybdopterin-dependent oxidoreductase [Chromobacterium violaceum]|uniref:Oxidase n=1 Tax=Chromobacterium violaceum TaxID=536 RepID=A0A202B9B7_CHRVL|nr:molybdopterin-dependent oxidoreductase [Chromobacterium violaceum]MBA8733396.1 molybdopterin-dependent oxidoreductase [Chromobacterium violaceum]OVE48134.1 oxidase [Chromobacterium violaceum]